MEVGGEGGESAGGQREVTAEEVECMMRWDEFGGGEGPSRGQVACIGVCGGQWRFQGCRVSAYMTSIFAPTG